MKIAYIIDRYWPAIGGAEKYVQTIAQHLTPKHDITIFTVIRDDQSFVDAICSPKHHSRDESQEDALSIITIRLPAFIRQIAFMLRVERPLHKLFPNHYYALRNASLHFGAHLVSLRLKDMLRDTQIIHSVGPWEMSRAVNLVKRPSQSHIITGLLHPGYWADDPHSIAHYKLCDRIIALSNTEAQAYIARGVNADRISVVGVPASYGHQVLPDSIDDRIKDPYILFLGAQRYYKGIDRLLSAASLVWTQIPDLYFVFAGPSTEYSRALFAQQADDSRIIQFDRVSEVQKWQLLNRCLALCLPSSTEIMPNVVLEAWTLKKPVIVSNIPTLRELVGKCGLLVDLSPIDLANAILKLLHHEDLGRQLGELGYLRCKTAHNAEFITSRLERVYKQSLDFL